MFPQSTTAILALVGLATVSAAAPSNLCGETAARVCYGRDGGIGQGVDPDDVQYFANSLPAIARKTEGDGLDAMWTMASDAESGGADCQEWTLPVSGTGTVLALAKHINTRINSSVLYSDMADAIDGGPRR